MSAIEDYEDANVDSQDESDVKEGFSRRLRMSLGEKMLSQADLVRLTGASKSKVSDYVRGNKLPSAVTLVAIAIGLGVRAEWLISGLGDSDGDSPKQSVPVLDMRLAAGAGAINTATMAKGHMLIDPIILQKLGVQAVAGLFVAECDGDSMEPLIQDGAPVLINGADTRLREGVFAFRLGESLRVKRLRPVGWGGIEVISDNTLYPPDRIQGEDLEHFEIIGKAIWAGTTL